ncbi:unnamed protein product [Closterium sp. Naga37s-1]|nr:unnamed protein product [Closterium sp. Naga37s-1]
MRLPQFKMWDLGEKRLVTSRDVVFEEDKFPSKGKPAPQLTFVLPAREEHEAVEIPPQAEKDAENEGGESNEESDDEVVEVPPTVAATSSTPSSPPLALIRERRAPHPNPKYDDYATVAVGKADEESVVFCFATMGDDSPRTHKEALASPDAPLWKQAMKKELASIKENDVFELVDPPKGAYFVGSIAPSRPLPAAAAPAACRAAPRTPCPAPRRAASRTPCPALLCPPRARPSRRRACPLRPLPRPPVRPAAGPAFAPPRLPVRPATGPPVRPSRTCPLHPPRARPLRPPCLRFAPAAGLHSLPSAALSVRAAARASALPRAT